MHDVRPLEQLDEWLRLPSTVDKHLGALEPGQLK
jgi:hypothetical protein